MGRVNDNDPELFYAKVDGFACSKTKERSMTYSHQDREGTLRYMAPEVMGKEGDGRDQQNSAKYPFKIDIFSFGMLCYEILTGNIPFYTLDQRTMQKAMLNGQRPSLPQQCPQGLKTLIEACWHRDPTSRPSSTEICQELRYLKYTSLLRTGMLLTIPQFVTIASYFLFTMQLSIYYPSSYKRYIKILLKFELPFNLTNLIDLTSNMIPLA